MQVVWGPNSTKEGMNKNKYQREVEEKKESIYSTYFDGSEDEKSGPAGSREARDGTA